jgi:hypothetical protein
MSHRHLEVHFRIFKDSILYPISHLEVYLLLHYNGNSIFQNIFPWIKNLSLEVGAWLK